MQASKHSSKVAAVLLIKKSLSIDDYFSRYLWANVNRMKKNKNKSVPHITLYQILFLYLEASALVVSVAVKLENKVATKQKQKWKTEKEVVVLKCKGNEGQCLGRQKKLLCVIYLRIIA